MTINEILNVWKFDSLLQEYAFAWWQRIKADSNIYAKREELPDNSSQKDAIDFDNFSFFSTLINLNYFLGNVVSPIWMLDLRCWLLHAACTERPLYQWGSGLAPRRARISLDDEFKSRCPLLQCYAGRDISAHLSALRYLHPLYPSSPVSYVSCCPFVGWFKLGRKC